LASGLEEFEDAVQLQRVFGFELDGKITRRDTEGNSSGLAGGRLATD
jgi:hypothetical protein